MANELLHNPNADSISFSQFRHFFISKTFVSNCFFKNKRLFALNQNSLTITPFTCQVLKTKSQVCTVVQEGIDDIHLCGTVTCGRNVQLLVNEEESVGQLGDLFLHFHQLLLNCLDSGENQYNVCERERGMVL